MTMRLDIATNEAAEHVRLEHARDLGAGVIVAIYRLVKLAQLHDSTNQAFVRQLDQTHHTIGEYGMKSGANVKLLFARKAIYVAGQLLRGSRATYESANELGDLLERAGGSELTIAREVTRDELYEFAQKLAQTARLERGRAPKIATSGSIHLRAVNEVARLRGLELEAMNAEQRIVRTYASAVVILRGFFEDLTASRYVLPRRIKRVAQSLVDLSEGSTAAFLGVTEARNANHDDAGKAVNTAILAVGTARELTKDRVMLAQIAMAALMHDVGRPRALALQSTDGVQLPGMAQLSEEQEDRLPAATAAVLTALGRLNDPSIRRTVIAYEALWLRRRASLGPTYRGVRVPTLHARIIAVSRRYNDLLTPEPGLAPKTADQAIAKLSEELREPIDRSVLRMLVAALGLLPIGTVVQLSTGEVGEVIARRGAPIVRVVVDAQGGIVAMPYEIDLAQVTPKIAVTRVVSIDRWKSTRESRPQIDDPPSRPSGLRAADELRAARAGSSPSLAPRGPSPSDPFLTEGMPEAPSQVRMPLLSAVPDAPDPNAPAASGSLETTPLSHVLVYMLDHQLTGSLLFREVTPGSAEVVEHTIYFMNGVAAKVRLARPLHRLGEILVANGSLSESALDEALGGAVRLGLLLGEYLVGHNIVTREALARALEKQIELKLAAIANMPRSTTYSYFRDMNLLETWGGGDFVVVGALNGILAVVRAWNDRDRISATLERLGKYPLVFHDLADVPALSLAAAEAAIVDVIVTRKVSLPDLLALGIAPASDVRSLVYALSVTRQFAFAGQKKGPMGARRVVVPDLASLRAPPLGKAMLAVRPSMLPRSGSIMPRASIIPPLRASIAPTRKKSSRPPREVAAPPEVTKPEFEVTTNPELNTHALLEADTAEGEEVNEELDDTAEDQEEIADGKRRFKSAEKALKKNQIETALALGEGALADEPRNPEYRAFVAWVRVMTPDGIDESKRAEGIAAMSEILSATPTCERALLYRGKLRKRDQPDDAANDFEALLELHPRHRDATRELKTLGR